MRTHYRSPILTSPNPPQDGTEDDDGAEEDEGREIDKTKTWGTGPRKFDLRVLNNCAVVATVASQIAKKNKMPEAEREAMEKDMWTGDFLHVLETFEKHCGTHATLFYGVGKWEPEKDEE